MMLLPKCLERKLTENDGTYDLIALTLLNIYLATIEHKQGSIRLSANIIPTAKIANATICPKNTFGAFSLKSECCIVGMIPKRYHCLLL
jgi:hypothetical protein